MPHNHHICGPGCGSGCKHGLLDQDLVSSVLENSEAKILPATNAPITGNTYVDSILWGGNKWDVGADGVIEYSFWGNGSESFDDFYGNYATTAYDWFDYEKAAMEAALETWSNVANITFVESTDNDAEATLGLYLTDNQLGALGMMKPPGTLGMGIGYFNWQGLGWNFAGLQQGGFGFITMIHEIGHGLGLAHPHDAGGGSSVFPGVSSPWDTGDFGLNQGLWTTMTYNDGNVADGLPVGSSYGYQGTPMALDIAAIQALYGANMSYNTGNDTYELPTVNASGTFYSSIWDAGGVDTITVGYSTTGDATINLNEAPLVGPNAGGYLSSVEGIYGGFTIANGVVIENAIGGAGDDVITGNAANNLIDGWSGDDDLYGKDGDDTILGYFGNDFIDGGAGNDSLYGESGNDFIDGWTGDDLMSGGNGEDTLLGWTGNDTLLGGAGSDRLIGESGDDFLNGYGGTLGEIDTLTGEFGYSQPGDEDTNDGADTFVLGNSLGAYYTGDGDAGYAIITDFYWAEGDKFQVYDSGTLSDYSLEVTQWTGLGAGTSATDTVISFQDDVIAVVQDTTNVFASADFVYA